MFPIRDFGSEKESWYIPGILVTFDSFDKALTWLIDFLKWFLEHGKFEDWSQQYEGKEPEEFSRLPFFKGIIKSVFLNVIGYHVCHSKDF